MNARTVAALTVGLALASNAFAQERQTRPVVRVADRLLAAEPRASAPVAIATDPYGFVDVLNQYRAAAGLSPVAFDSDLSAWASQNNAAQSRRGIGHFVNPNCYQNAAWNCVNAYDVAQAWMNSPGHRRNMLSPNITRVGIAYGPGPYWTMNAR
jgi:uncharacterized protein YkwD